MDNQWILETSIHTVLSAGMPYNYHSVGDNTPLDPMGACLFPGHWGSLGRNPEINTMSLREFRQRRANSRAIRDMSISWDKAAWDFLQEVQDAYDAERRKIPAYFIARFILRCAGIAERHNISMGEINRETGGAFDCVLKAHSFGD